jgi:Flp pilus assembly pilin Flp
VEYAVMLALIIIVCLASIRTFGRNTNTSFTNSAQSIAS